MLICFVIVIFMSEVCRNRVKKRKISYQYLQMFCLPKLEMETQQSDINISVFEISCFLIFDVFRSIFLHYIFRKNNFPLKKFLLIKTEISVKKWLSKRILKETEKAFQYLVVKISLLIKNHPVDNVFSTYDVTLTVQIGTFRILTF